MRIKDWVFVQLKRSGSTDPSTLNLLTTVLRGGGGGGGDHREMNCERDRPLKKFR